MHCWVLLCCWSLQYCWVFLHYWLSINTFLSMYYCVNEHCWTSKSIDEHWGACMSFEDHIKCPISILTFYTNLCPIVIDLSGNTIWPKATVFHKLPNWPRQVLRNHLLHLKMGEITKCLTLCSFISLSFGVFRFALACNFHWNFWTSLLRIL